jgi:cobalt-zinc-cadmium resistance protein CzcA
LLRAIIERSVKYRSAAVLIAAAVVIGGIWSACRLSLDVTPDISNLQVQVLTPVPDLSPEEIETSVTRPIELEMFGLPGLEQVRSLTRFGVSQVSLIFSDGTDLYRARQMAGERLAGTVGKIPPAWLRNWPRPARAWAKFSLMRWLTSPIKTLPAPRRKKGCGV